MKLNPQNYRTFDDVDEMMKELLDDIKYKNSTNLYPREGKQF